MLLVWERGGGGSAGVTQAGQHQGSLRLVVVSFSYDQQHGWVFFFSHIQLSNGGQE